MYLTNTTKHGVIQLNKYIKQMAIEAKLIAPEYDYTLNPEYTGFEQTSLLPSQQAFAEAIIRRCAQIAWRNTPDTEEMQYGHLISDKITEYFGIK